MLGTRRSACLLLIIFTSARVDFQHYIALAHLTCSYFTRHIIYVNVAINISHYCLLHAIMSPIAFKRSGSSCNYDDSSATNPCLKNGTLGIRKVIGLADKKTWDKEWRPIFINFIESANVTSIDLTKDKARSKNELLTKIREFIELVRDKTASNVPDDFLEAALFILVKDLRSQVVATKKAVVKEEQREQSSRLTSVPANTPAPSLTPAPTSRSEYLAVPLVSGRTPITLQRANSNGLIAVRMAFWGNLTVFPPSLPLAEQLPELSAWKLSIVQQHLKFYQLWNDHETIYWMDSTGTPILLMNDLDLHHMVYAAQNPQETVKARKIMVRGSDNEQVQCTLLDV